jgi:hypothetical protein
VRPRVKVGWMNLTTCIVLDSPDLCFDTGLNARRRKRKHLTSSFGIVDVAGSGTSDILPEDKYLHIPTLGLVRSCGPRFSR